ncbi:MAG: toll/interleukin-1 receptor domain-containing protein, partial [Synergistaceae bacterium]|nr:toll/interleukin-1 receptor domain-containing protein [Synergistaceae bacterium]
MSLFNRRKWNDTPPDIKPREAPPAAVIENRNEQEPELKISQRHNATEPEFVRRARGTEIPRRTQRIFLCCDVGNCGERETLVADILSQDAGVDCVLTYLPDSGGAADGAALLNELQQSQAMVLLVSRELLASLEGARPPLAYTLAREHGVPVLPVAVDDKLFPAFTKLAGAVHGISFTDAEYRGKLRQQLETFLASETLIAEITEKAFIANLFLSYRKKDLTEARKFMESFHDISGFEPIAVWYDNFLTAGRIFDDEIRESIQKSDAFVLLVTPNLQEPGNYVLTEEYPYAIQTAHKSVIAVEAVPTDRAKFRMCFPAVDALAALDEQEPAFRKVLPEHVFEEERGPERDYLLGMAFLKGILVERQPDRAIRLLALAAGETSGSSLRAAEQLASIYELGIGGNVDYAQALQWRTRCLEISRSIFGDEHRGVAAAYNNIGVVYEKTGDYRNAMEMYRNDLQISVATLGPDHPETAVTYNNLAQLKMRMGDYDGSVEMNELALGIRRRALGEDHPEVASSYNNMALAYNKKGYYSKALELYKNALGIRERIQGTENADIAVNYNNIGILYEEMGDFACAMQYCEKAVAIMKKRWGEDHINTALAYNAIASIYGKTGLYENALSILLNSLSILERTLGENHPDVATLYTNLGSTYDNMGEYAQALEMCNKALSVNNAAQGEAHPENLKIYNSLGMIYDHRGEYDRALEMYDKAMNVPTGADDA